MPTHLNGLAHHVEICVDASNGFVTVSQSLGEVNGRVSRECSKKHRWKSNHRYPARIIKETQRAH